MKRYALVVPGTSRAANRQHPPRTPRPDPIAAQPLQKGPCS
jgi:hypothetical protein